jgi:carbon starvation protein CstA
MWKNAFLEFSSPIFHSQSLTDISVEPTLTQSSLYPSFTLANISLQKIKLIALTLMLYVAYHARYHLLFSMEPHQDSVPQ